MTTRRVMEIEDEGLAMPDFVHGGQGFLIRSPRIKTGFLQIDAYIDYQPHQSDAEKLMRLKGKVC